MKYITNIVRVLVGVLFIISGFIKLDDPIGFSYKLEEYFSADVLNLPFLEPYALAISVFVVIFEVVLGVFLLIGYQKKFTLWNLLLMIVFFTFLTFYSAYFDKVKDCGCFGDALKLTPWGSFTKDIVLLVLILILFAGEKYIKPLFSKLVRTIIALLSFIVCLWFGYHVLMHLPAVDFRAYKIGKNIKEGMVIPENAPKAEVEYSWKFNVNGKEEIHTTNGSYPTVEGEFVSVDTKVIKEGYEPPVKDFSIESENENLTDYYLAQPNLIIVASYSLEKAEKAGLAKLKAFTNKAIKKGYTVIGLTASGKETKEAIKNKYSLNFDFYLCDEKAIKTIVRSNPGVLELQKGTVTQKVHWNDIDDLKLKELPTAQPNLNFKLKKQLDSIIVLDQKYRSDMQLYRDNYKAQNAIDSTNLIAVQNIIKKHGYPGKSLVGAPTNTSAWYVIQHSEKIGEYLPVMKKAAKNNELPFAKVAMMEDRYLMSNNEPQIYGTQGRSFKEGSVTVIWPIKDPKNVNQRRKEAGFETTVEEGAKRLYGEDFEYKPLTLKDVAKYLKK